MGNLTKTSQTRTPQEKILKSGGEVIKLRKRPRVSTREILAALDDQKILLPWPDLREERTLGVLGE